MTELPVCEKCANAVDFGQRFVSPGRDKTGQMRIWHADCAPGTKLHVRIMDVGRAWAIMHGGRKE